MGVEMVSSINHAQENIEEIKSIEVTNPIELDASIIYGHFPSFENFKELAVFKFNRFLTCTLINCIIISMA
ncbi:MAG: hypothetical protein PHV68_08120, partial [Candidatus Gastranaerophilales bacterium]|nr:hypothetical protein [Candidatus Gastranaerophilales bacterium]